MRRSLLLLLGFGGAIVEVVPTPATAQGLPSPAVDVSGSCPESSAVWSVLAGLLPANPPTGAPPVASVSDHGATYVVSVGPRVKTYSDVSRDCAQRARVAAAFISLSLVPDAVPDTSATPPEAPPPPAPGPPPAPSRPEPTRPASLWVLADARGTGDSAPQNGLFAPGVALGIAAGKGRLGGQWTCGWVSSSSMSTGTSGSVLLERFPCSIGPLLRLTPTDSPLDVRTSLGLVVGALRVRGVGFVSDYDSVRLELGARLSVDAVLHLGQPADIAPVLGVAATYDPSAYDLSALPHGVVGHTPSWWAGASAGVSWGVP